MLINTRNWLLAGFMANMAISPVGETPAVRPGRRHPEDQGPPGGRWLRVRRCQGSLLYALILGALVTSVLVMAEPRLAAARPDPPVIDGDTATCTGDQHLGIASGIDFQTPPILNLYVNSLTTDITPDNGVAGIKMLHQGANGGNGTSYPVIGGSGGNGDLGQSLTVNFAGGSHAIITQGDIAAGILVQSAGGNGGNGGDAYLAGTGGNGGNGANGGTLTVTSNGLITTSGSQAHGILAASQGGNGGNGGSGYGVYGIGGNGGAGGNGDAVTVTSSSAITTQGEKANGIFVVSVGGNSGTGGAGYGAYGEGGNGGNGGNSGNVTLTSTDSIITSGDNANGIFALSQAGDGGNGGDAAGVAGIGGDGGIGGTAGAVTVTSQSNITTSGKQAQGIAAQSLGGAGGNGGSGGGVYGQGGAALGSGPGGRVEVTSTGAIVTSGTESRGIFAQSVGGFAGSSGGAGGIVAFGASGESAGSGGEVAVTNSGAIISTSSAIFAESVGGGGGSGGASAGLISLGGSGGSGGDGGAVAVTNSGALSTSEANASAIFAQSVGGGGGNGGGAVAVGIWASVAIGGSASQGGAGNTVTVINNAGGNIITTGDSSHGILAQSVGGGGGHGGFAVAGTISGVVADPAVSIGGQGGGGGTGNTVVVQNFADITTLGSNSHGILAQSVGGGGGDGGFSIAVATLGLGYDVPVAIGGAGGSGGNGGAVTVGSDACNLSTTGDNSHGILAQSVGGGGGDGGFSVAASAGSQSINVGIGGSGGNGGAGNLVSVTSSSNITTLGNNSGGILAQSIGGGGGSGGWTVGGGVDLFFNVAVAVGGTGGGGGNGSQVSVSNAGAISTFGSNATGILAQSVGGGGGNGGWSVAAAFSGNISPTVSVGGSGGTGGSGDVVTVTNSGQISTQGESSQGILAQSVGGGGGNGGFSVSASGAVLSLTASVGGSGGIGGSGNKVTVNNAANIYTQGDNSQGILAQSVGGGGGNGGCSIAGNLDIFGAYSAGVGGSGGSGGNGLDVTVNNSGNISTSGSNATGILAQSVGGGGGNGGFNITGNVSIVGSDEFSLGGSGGTGDNGQNVTVNTSGSISTSGNNATGILAQSVGGGGGNGGFSVAGSGSIMGNVSVSVGGNGNVGGAGGNISLTSNSSISTQGAYSDGILAQSVGGGGGNGGWSVSGSIALGVVPEIPLSVGVAISLGGRGGAGGAAGPVYVTSNGEQITTVGDASRGIFAQSLGGGGGNGGFSGAVALAVAPTVPVTLALSVGGSGGTGNTAGLVEVNSSSNISTQGNDSQGILAQSIGGGGGNGAFSGTVIATGTPVGTSIFGASLSIGGNGENGGDSLNDPTTGLAVKVNSTGSLITTSGTNSTGILAQSIGGGGGNGGISLNVAVGGVVNLTDVPIFSQGCKAGGGGNAGAVLVANSSNIYTTGDYASGILAQSVGGGGGLGGTKISGSVGLSVSEKGPSFGVSLGASGSGGGGGGNADAVTVTESLAPGQTNKIISTQGFTSAGILAQSIGGGGGAGGFNLSAGVSVSSKKIFPSLDFNCGSSGGAGGSAGAVAVTSVSTIQTLGESSQGILAQSIGGGGGNGGTTISASVGADLTILSGFHVSMGGDGGSGGNGAQVTVTSTSEQILTTGNSSAGILAQSVGGGGGTGGGSIGVSIGLEAAVVPPLSFALGGKGGSGGSAGDVTVASSSSIYTGTYDADTGVFKSGNDSQGIMAQSVGGGGGNAGYSIFARADLGALLGGTSISLGGEGGAGNTAGAVDVTSTGAVIRTLGDRSQGILAQSLGGGGGNGGFSIAGGLSNGIELAVSDGGNGGSGANGGTVTVTNSSTIITGYVDLDDNVYGHDSAGILAQSLGGGGGNGAFSVSGAVGLLCAPSLSFGGYGAGGGDGAGVTINNTGAMIITLGDRAAGISGQSVGGGGGNGGFSIAGGLSCSLVDLALTYGSNGGFGGSGGAVTINNNPGIGIGTSGNDSQAILAQSLGGGGGNGAFSVAGDLTLVGVGVGLSFGSNAGSGGSGGAVTVTDTGVVLVTSGERSVGIQAQSIGGGGGYGGFIVAGSLGTAGALSLSMGGGNGTNGAGGAVAVTSSSSIITEGNDSTAILAQSIGGGGGVGGVNVNGDLTGATSVDVTLGASGAGGGNGNDVAIVATGSNILTFGDRSSGILAQSIGGGGGVGWVGVGGSAQANSATLTLGGQNGASGDGGQVTVQNSSNMSIFGTGSYGIVAQSIGGGGGVGSNAALASASGVTLGGGAEVAGAGGAVSVTNTGQIFTEAPGSYGIIAQSIGGGGGLAGYAGGAISGVNTSMPQGDGTNSGNGSSVSITNAGIIATSGYGAMGIVAQSIGGGGGLNVASGNAGSAGGLGSGGEITIAHSGTLYTTGDYAHGIFAQSVGGQGSGSNININVDGTVWVEGQGADGIYAQSKGDAGNGNISVTIAETGFLYCGSQSGAAVSFVDGKDNLLQNYGMIEAAGLAVTSTDGANTTINNYGGMYCSIQLGQGTNVFNNLGTFWSGAVVNLGAGNSLNNSGNLEIGGPGVVATTTLTGNFAQTGTGILQVDLDYLTRTADELLVSGTAKVDGKVGLTNLNPGFIMPGSHQDTILSAAGGLDFPGQSLVFNSIVMQSQLFVRNSTDLVLRSNVNFDPSGLSGNQHIMGDYLNRVLLAGGGEWLNPLIGYYLGLGNSQSLGAAYDTLLPYTAEADTLSTIQVNRQYLRDFQNRMEWLRPSLWRPAAAAQSQSKAKPVLLAYNGPDSQLGQLLAPEEPASIQKRAGFWLNGFSQFAHSSADGFTGFNYTTAGTCAGFDYAFTDRFVAGVGGGYGGTSLDLSGGWGHSNFNSYYATLYGTYFTDLAYFEGVLSYAKHQYHDSRYIDVGTTKLNATSSHDGDSFSSVFEAGITFRPQRFVIQPFTALSYIYLNEGSFQESGAGDLGLKIDSRQSNSLSSEVGARLARPIKIPKGTLVPKVSAAWLHDFQIDKLSIPAAFQGAPNAGFVVNSRNLGQERAVLGAEIAFISNKGISASLRYDADLGNNFTSQAVTGQLKFSF